MSEARARDPWFDNTRLVAAVLIAVMHFLVEILPRSSTAHQLFVATWPMRVPLFVVLAGYFSDARPLSGRRTVVLVRNILFVYLAIDLIAMLRKGLADDIWRYEPMVPAFGMWFLLSLFCWRLLLPVLVRIRWIGAISVVTALVAGFMPAFGTTFSASRTVVLMPLFLLGWHLRSRGLHWVLDRRVVRWCAVGVLLAVAVVAAVWGDQINRGPLQFAGPYPGSFAQQFGHAGHRALALLVGTAGALSAIALVPRRRVPLVTTLGSGAMYIYVLHPLVVSQLRSVDFFDRMTSATDLVVLVVGSAAFAMTLASRPVRRVFQPLVQPRYEWLFRPEPGPPSSLDGPPDVRAVPVARREVPVS